MFPDDYINHRQNKIQQFITSSKENTWQHLIREFKQIRYLPYLGNIFESLCSISLPNLSLQRETYGMHCNSDFQRYLATKLESDQQFVYKQLNEQDQIIEDFRKNEQFKEEFLFLRWWDNSLLEESIQKHISPEIPPVLQMMIGFQKAIQNYTQGIFLHLSSFINSKIMKVNPYELISEYCLYWQHFRSAIIQIEKDFSTQINLVNEIYENLFPQFSQFPKYSIWKMMVRAWVGELKKEDMFYLLEKSGEMKYQMTILKGIKEQTQEINDIIDENVDLYNSGSISHELYDNFVNRSKISKKSCEYEFELENFFDIQIDQILFNFIISFQDISLNDITIHWYGHSDVIYELPFQQIQKTLRQETWNMYKSKRVIFEKNYDHILAFLKQDLKQKNKSIKYIRFIKSICDEPTVNIIYAIQKEFVFTELSYCIEEDFVRTLLEGNEQLIKEMFSKNYSTEQEDSLIQIETQEDQEDAASKLMQLFMDSPNLKIEDLKYQELQKDNRDPLEEIITTSIQNTYHLVEKILNTMEDEDPSDLPQIHRRPRTFSQIKRSQQLCYIPIKFVQFIEKKVKEHDQYGQIVQHFKHFCFEYDTRLINVQMRNSNIEAINQEREIPFMIPQKFEEFYSINGYVNEQLLKRVSAIDQLEIDFPGLSKTSSKYEK